MIYDQIWVWNSVSKTLSTETLSTRDVPYFLPLSRAAGRDGATRRDHPSQGHGSSPAALHQMPRCTADECASIAPGQFSFGPDFDAELPAVPAPQRVTLHPQQLHISTSRELLAYPWWPFASAKTGYPQESNQKPHDRADSSHCAAATEPPCACICGQVLRACQPVLLPLKHLVYRPSSYSKHCGEEAACGQCLTRSEWLPPTSQGYTHGVDFAGSLWAVCGF